MKKYNLEIFIDEQAGIVTHEKADSLNSYDAHLIMSVLEEYKQRLLTYIMVTEQHKDLKEEGKKVE